MHNTVIDIHQQHSVSLLQSMLAHAPLKQRKRASLATTLDHRSYTALHMAVEAGLPDIARLLIKNVRCRASC